MKFIRKMKFKTFWKSYVTDIALLVLTFLLGFYAKGYIANFFTHVDSFEEKFLLLEPGLANQSTSALLQAEGVVNEFSMLVYFTFIFMLVVVPAVLYLLLVISQSLDVAFIKNKLSFKFLWKSVVLGVPLLVLFLIIEGSLTYTFSTFLDSFGSLFFAFFYLLVLILMGYVWYVLAVQLYDKKKFKMLNYKMLYQKFYPLFFVFGIFFLLFFIILGIVGFTLVRFFTDSFLGNSWVVLVIMVLILLAIVQIVRIRFVKLVSKYI